MPTKHCGILPAKTNEAFQNLEILVQCNFVVGKKSENDVVSFISLGLASNFSPFESDVRREAAYSEVYIPLLHFLNENPKIGWTFFFTGYQLDWLKKHHSESVILLEQLVNSGQVEILGGGYYGPYFEFLPSIDRNHQIELLTTHVRKLFSKKPRGFFVEDSAWHSSLINSLCINGFRYSFIEDTLFKDCLVGSMSIHKHFIVEDCDKYIYLFPYSSAPPDFDNILAENKTEDSVFVNFINEDVAKTLFTNDFFQKIIEVSERIKFSSIANNISNLGRAQKINLLGGLNSSKSNFIREKNFIGPNYRAGAKDFIKFWPELSAMYYRMLYTESIINQGKLDKIQKDVVKTEKILPSQCHHFFLPSGNRNEIRSKFYNYLLSAEKIVRRKQSVKSGITYSDIDCDDRIEYIAQHEQYTAFISLVGGVVFELDVFSNCHNYANTPCENNFFEKKLFVDTMKIGDKFLKLYECDYKYSKPTKSEVLITTVHEGIFIKKRFLFSNSAFSVQYIITNKTGEDLDAEFFVENYFSVKVKNFLSQSLELIAEDHNFSFKNLEANEVCFDNASFIQLTDPNQVAFILEPNEIVDVSIRPVENEGHFVATSVKTKWHLNIKNGGEIERTISLMIRPEKSGNRQWFAKNS